MGKELGASSDGLVTAAKRATTRRGEHILDPTPGPYPGKGPIRYRRRESAEARAFRRFPIACTSERDRCLLVLRELCEEDGHDLSWYTALHAAARRLGGE